MQQFFCTYFLEFNILSKYFQIPCVFPKFSNSPCFPCLELLFTIFPVFPVEWEPCIKVQICRVKDPYVKRQERGISWLLWGIARTAGRADYFPRNNAKSQQTPVNGKL